MLCTHLPASLSDGSVWLGVLHGENGASLTEAEFSPLRSQGAYDEELSEEGAAHCSAALGLGNKLMVGGTMGRGLGFALLSQDPLLHEAASQE